MRYETVSENERVYFDTSMWVAIILGNRPSNRGFQFAQDKFQELTNGAFHVYVSDLVLMESVWAIRNRTVGDKANHQMSKDDLETMINCKVEFFYQEIMKAQMAGMVTVENPKDSLDWFLQRSHSISSKPQKNALFYRQKGKEYRYVGTGFLDFQHAIIATDLKCDRFYTTDQGFERLKSMPEFRTLSIVTP